MGLVSRLSLANNSNSESFLVVHALSSQDGCQREGFWEVVRHVVSPFDLSWTLPVCGSLLVLCSLPGPPVLTAQANGYYSAWQRWAVSVYMLPLTILGTETALQRYLKFAGVGGPIIFTLPGAERLKTKPLRAAVLSHRAVFRTKRTQAVRSQTCSQGTLWQVTFVSAGVGRC